MVEAQSLQRIVVLTWPFAPSHPWKTGHISSQAALKESLDILLDSCLLQRPIGGIGNDIRLAILTEPAD